MCWELAFWNDLQRGVKFGALTLVMDSSEDETSGHEDETVSPEQQERMRQQLRRDPRRITRGLMKQLSGDLAPSRDLIGVNALPDVFLLIMDGLSTERVLYNEGKIHHLIMVQFHEKRFSADFTSVEDFANGLLDIVRAEEKYKVPLPPHHAPLTLQEPHHRQRGGAHAAATSQK